MVNQIHYPHIKTPGGKWVSHPLHVKEIVPSQEIVWSSLVYVIGIWILRIFSPDFSIGFWKCSGRRFWKCSGRVTLAFHIPNTRNPKYLQAKTITGIEQHYENLEYCSDWPLGVR